MTKTVKEAVRLSQTNDNVFSISMPDTFFSDPNSFDGSFLLALRKLAPSLALWQIREDQIGKLGQIQIDSVSGFVKDMIDKDPDCKYPHLWGMMAIGRQLLEEFDEKDSHPGISLRSKVEMGLRVSHVQAVGDYLDCGTPSEYYRAFSTNIGPQ
jgi:hypothetical protein